MGSEKWFVWASWAALAPVLSGCGSVVWESSLESGFRKAAERRCPLLVQFHRVLDADCAEMDRTVFADPQVQERLTDFVPVRLDYNLHRELADRLGVQVVPTFFVFRYDRSLAGACVGKLDAERFNVFLIKYRYY